MRKFPFVTAQKEPLLLFQRSDQDLRALQDISEWLNRGFELFQLIYIPCMIDRGQLKRAFANIVGNAAKRTPKETTLYFGLTQAGKHVRLLLADNDLGIPKGLEQDIFTPFVMGDTSRSGTGSGLGLSIAKRIVEAHGGSIRLGDNTGSRWTTVFEITLPTLSK